jgi:hypothetical protein
MSDLLLHSWIGQVVSNFSGIDLNKTGPCLILTFSGQNSDIVKSLTFSGQNSDIVKSWLYLAFVKLLKFRNVEQTDVRKNIRRNVILIKSEL